MQTPVREWLEKRQENLAGLLYRRIMAGFDDLMVLFFCRAINQSALDIIWSSSGRNKTLAFSFSLLIKIGIKCFLLPKLQLECLKKLTLFQKPDSQSSRTLTPTAHNVWTRSHLEALNLQPCIPQHFISWFYASEITHKVEIGYPPHCTFQMCAR